MIVQASARLSLRPSGLLVPAEMLRADRMALLLSGGLRIEGGSGPVDSVEAAILNHAFGKATWTPPATYYLALSTTTPTDAAGNFTEPVGGSYARVHALAADWNSASSTAPTVLTNANSLAFPAATGSWGTCTYLGLYDASSAGAFTWFGALAVAQSITTGATLSFAAGAIVMQCGDPADAF